MGSFLLFCSRGPILSTTSDAWPPSLLEEQVRPEGFDRVHLAR